MWKELSSVVKLFHIPRYCPSLFGGAREYCSQESCTPSGTHFFDIEIELSVSVYIKCWWLSRHKSYGMSISIYPFLTDSSVPVFQFLKSQMLENIPLFISNLGLIEVYSTGSLVFLWTKVITDYSVPIKSSIWNLLSTNLHIGLYGMPYKLN